MNIAPPPLIRRTTETPWRATPSGSTSLRSDWKLPITTEGDSHSQNRRVGLRMPSPTSRVRISSIATCIAVLSGVGGMISQVWSAMPVERPRARRTAVATASGENPKSWAEGSSRLRTASAKSDGAVSTGSPSSAALMSSSASSGSRKKSPLTETPLRRPPATSRSTAVSLPPGVLNSPCRRVRSSPAAPSPAAVVSWPCAMGAPRSVGGLNEVKPRRCAGVASLSERWCCAVRNYFLPKPLKRALKRSTRPAESMIRCLPV
jgi:hypothetical protein